MESSLWSSTRQVVEATRGKGESSQFAEVKAVQLALGVAEWERQRMLDLYTDSRVVANAFWSGHSSRNKTTGNEGVNLFSLLTCGKILLPK